jgi:hypothetical protein
MVSSSGVIGPTMTAMSPSPGQTRTAQAGRDLAVDQVQHFAGRQVSGSKADRREQRLKAQQAEAGPSQGLNRRRFVGTGCLVLAGETVDGGLPAQAGREQGYGHRHQGGVPEEADEFVLVLWFRNTCLLDFLCACAMGFSMICRLLYLGHHPSRLDRLGGRGVPSCCAPIWMDNLDERAWRSR